MLIETILFHYFFAVLGSQLPEQSVAADTGIDRAVLRSASFNCPHIRTCHMEVSTPTFNLTINVSIFCAQIQNTNLCAARGKRIIGYL